jgi:predicted DNA-binding protein
MPVKETKALPLSIRVPPEMMKRLDKLIPKLVRDTSVASLGVVTRSTAAKVALDHGLRALEEKYR